MGRATSAGFRATARRMKLISTTEELAGACERLASKAYVTVDTEFMRETTYYPSSASSRSHRWARS